MSFLGNLIWLVFGGLLAGLSYILGGFVLCLTIIGIPYGVKAMRFGWLVMMPFGKGVAWTWNAPGCLSGLVNLLWLVMVGWSIALTHLLFGVILLPTLVGIPLALQHFKLLPVALFPFSYGAWRLSIVRKCTGAHRDAHLG